MPKPRRKTQVRRRQIAQRSRRSRLSWRNQSRSGGKHTGKNRNRLDPPKSRSGKYLIVRQQILQRSGPGCVPRGYRVQGQAQSVGRVESSARPRRVRKVEVSRRRAGITVPQIALVPMMIGVAQRHDQVPKSPVRRDREPTPQLIPRPHRDDEIRYGYCCVYRGVE